MQNNHSLGWLVSLDDSGYHVANLEIVFTRETDWKMIAHWSDPSLCVFWNGIMRCDAVEDDWTVCGFYLFSPSLPGN